MQLLTQKRLRSLVTAWQEVDWLLFVLSAGLTFGIGPVTGIPLPWVSYGRSAMPTNFIAIGIVELVANYRQWLKF